MIEPTARFTTALARAVALLPEGRAELVREEDEPVATESDGEASLDEADAAEGADDAEGEDQAPRARRRGSQRRSRKQHWRISFLRPNGKPIEIISTIYGALYAAVNALITDPKHGGFGDSVDSVRQALLFNGAIPATGIGAHEETMLKRIVTKGILPMDAPRPSRRRRKPRQYAEQTQGEGSTQPTRPRRSRRQAAADVTAPPATPRRRSRRRMR